MLPKDTRHLIQDHIINEEVRTKIQQAIGPHKDLTVVKRCKLQWYPVMSHIHQDWPKPSCKAQ